MSFGDLTNSTHSLKTDPTLIGKRLEAVTALLAEGRLKSVAALPERFAELNPAKPFVAKIDVMPFRE